MTRSAARATLRQLQSSRIVRTPADSRTALLACLVVAGCAFAVYAQVRAHEFDNFDTPVYVSNNPVVREGLTLHGVGWAFTTFTTANWHPLTWLSLMSDVELFGLAPGAHHLMSVAFHLASSCLLLLLLFRASGALWPSALAAACFALHPMQVEAVAWGAQRKDVLSTFFLMLTLAAYLRYAERPGARRLAAALLFFALGLLAKPMLVSVPLLLLLLDYWPLAAMPGTSLRSLVAEKVPFLVLALGVGVVTLVAQHSQGRSATSSGIRWVCASRTPRSRISCTCAGPSGRATSPSSTRTHSGFPPGSGCRRSRCWRW